MLQRHDVEATVTERQLERARDLERYLPALPGALGQIACGIDERLAEVDARHPAAMARGQKARRPADARPDVENRHVGGDPGQRGKLGGGGEPARVDLVER